MAKKIPNIPGLLPPKIDYNKIYKNLGDANKAVGELKGLLFNIPNKFLLVDPLLTNEALSSSRIEGTQATLEEVLEYEASKRKIDKLEKEEDIREVLNYRTALGYAIRRIEGEGIPIGENFIKEVHALLLNSARGEARDRGNLRRGQVYVGRPGFGIEAASYVPPPATELPSLLSNWEKYVNIDENDDPLVLAAVSHYQFEAIHPFMDGNGRIGRILIPIILYQRGYLEYPYLYLSEYFDYRRDIYITMLQNMDESKVWEDWVNFFLKSVSIQAKATKIKGIKMLQLYHETRKKVEKSKSLYGGELLDILFSNGIISYSLVKDILKPKSNQTVYNLLNRFQKEGILEVVDESKRGKVYIFTELLDILKSTAFE